MPSPLTAEILLNAYANGIFPMAEHRGDTDLFWVDPRQRGILPLDGFHISRSLAKTIRKSDFLVQFNTDFNAVVQGCAAREETWINDTLVTLYTQLHAEGFAHSVEIRNGERLVGGVFGITIGGAFFGESMFSTARDASKLALAYLVDRLREGGFTLFDTQFITAHLQSLGGVEIPRADYRLKLARAIGADADFNRLGEIPGPDQLLQRKAQTS